MHRTQTCGEWRNQNIGIFFLDFKRGSYETRTYFDKQGMWALSRKWKNEKIGQASHFGKFGASTWIEEDHAQINRMLGYLAHKKPPSCSKHDTKRCTDHDLELSVVGEVYSMQQLQVSKERKEKVAHLVYATATANACTTKITSALLTPHSNFTLIGSGEWSRHRAWAAGALPVGQEQRGVCGEEEHKLCMARWHSRICFIALCATQC
jgi:hypothetical protein